MNHLKAIAEKLEAYGLDAMLVTSEPGEFYAIGFHGEGVAVVGRNETRYFTDSRYIESAEKQVTGAQITMTTREVGHRALALQAVREMGVGRLGIEEGYMTVQDFRSYEKELPCTLVPAQQLLSDLRAVKDAEEREALIAAQRIAERALDEILGFIRPGMTEKEIAAKLVYDMLRFGAEKMSLDVYKRQGRDRGHPLVPLVRRAGRRDRPVSAGTALHEGRGCGAGPGSGGEVLSSGRQTGGRRRYVRAGPVL